MKTTKNTNTKICPGCWHEFEAQHPNRVYCYKCEARWTRERNFHQRRYPRASLMRDLGEEY